jgi:hypothetical protein
VSWFWNKQIRLAFVSIRPNLTPLHWSET